MPLLPLPALDTLDDGLQLPVAEGLEQIVHRPQLHRRLGIGEVAVGGEEDHIGPVALGPELPYHLQSTQPGHLDVGNDEVGAVACDDLQSLLAVGGLPHHGAAHRGPVHRQNDTLADQLLVLHDDHL